MSNATTTLAERVAARRWWHTMDLGNGIVTAGQQDSPSILPHLHLPPLAGKSVLDIGAWDGAFSFAAEQLGAARVLATDKFVWDGKWDSAGDGGFDLAHEALGSHVEKQRIGVEELSPETVGVFDVALFLGVLYHAQDPMRYLRILRSVTREVAIIETHTDAADFARPAAVFYPKGALNGDWSNFWGPNRACVEAMLIEVGFARVEHVASFGPSRMVFHAWA